ncbi:MAG: hypothetical protein M3N28_03230 [Actinomycetota bacterium]|nr:hypothetical protein [Actinomycetota bacterium]
MRRLERIPGEDGSGHERGVLRARPDPNHTATPVPAGTQPLAPGPGRTGLVYVPSNYSIGQPATLVVTLHGAGGDARGGLVPLRALADEFGLLLLAPESRGRTWDVLVGGFGPDVEVIDQALAHAFDRYVVDPARVIVAGFSDGASYALSLGVTNGDLFGSVLAFSPGFAAPGTTRGSPRLFISHGIGDSVLGIDATSRKLVPRFRGAGYDVRYLEFEGGHTVPPEVARSAVTWALGRTP